MRFVVAALIIAIAGVSAFGQAPTLRIVTDDPNLPSDLFYGNVKVKPLRVRPGSNPPKLITIDDSDFFVQEQYIDFLNRMPDPSGFGFWNGEITSCAGNATCVDIKRVNVSAAFFISIEFQQTGYLVEKLYKASYGDVTGNSAFPSAHTLQVPVVQFSEFLPDTKTIGLGVVVGQGNWQAVLEANKVAFLNAFVQRSRFTDPSAYPTSMTPAAFVAKLNSNIGNVLSAQEQADAIAEFAGAGNTADNAARARSLRKVAENGTFNNNEYNRAFVLMQYFGYLRRNPNSGPDSDHTGFDFWLQKLNNFTTPGDDVLARVQKADMVKSFIVAGEYKGRF
jgi:hypothetical protein